MYPEIARIWRRGDSARSCLVNSYPSPSGRLKSSTTNSNSPLANAARVCRTEQRPESSFQIHTNSSFHANWPLMVTVCRFGLDGRAIRRIEDSSWLRPSLSWLRHPPVVRSYTLSLQSSSKAGRLALDVPAITLRSTCHQRIVSTKGFTPPSCARNCARTGTAVRDSAQSAN